MFKGVTLFLVFLATGAQSAVLIDAENNNGGFVSEATGFNGAPGGWTAQRGVWVAAGGSPLDSQPFGIDDGDNSRFVQIHNDAGETLSSTQRMSVAPGDTVELSFDYRTGGSGADTALTVALYDAAAGTNYAVFGTLDTGAAVNEFTQVDFSHTAATSNDYIYLRFSLPSAGGLGKDFHIDRVHLSGANLPPPPTPIEYSTLQLIMPEDDEARIVEKAAKTLPRPNQIAWQKLEQTYFIHFGVNTFTGREWGTGTEDPDIFNPSRFDAGQWVEEIAAAGGKMVILTVKHHDGFCLWPSRYTHHDVASSSWLGGQGDVLRAVADACHARGIKLGIYLSPADLYQIESAPGFGSGLYGNGSPTQISTIPTNPDTFSTDPSQTRTPPAGRPTFEYEVDDYNRYFLNQLYELLTEYGPIAEMWFDGANPKQTDPPQLYSRTDWYEMIYELQPEVLIAIDGPDVRWVGNESGIARETEWSVLPFSDHPLSGSGRPNGMAEDIGSRSKLIDAQYLWWFPAEADTKILSGWFWNDSHSVRDTSTLLDIYYSSVGRNSNLLLNLSPDTRGLIPDSQLESLRPFGQIVRNTFAVDMADGAEVTVPPDSLSAGALLIDDDPDTFWEAPESSSTAQIVFELPQEQSFDVVSLQEAVAERGQRIEGFAIETWNGSGWEEQTRGTTVGYKRLLRLDSPVSTRRVRLNITACRMNPALAEVALHKQALGIAAPVIGARDAAGRVSIANGDGRPIRFTLDGSAPDQDSQLYSEAVDLSLGGSLRAASFGDDGLPGIIATRSFPNLAPIGWSAAVDSGAASAANAIDDDPATLWESLAALPQAFTIDLGGPSCVVGMTYQPPAGGGAGTVRRYRIESSLDGVEWTERAAGEFGNIRNSPVLQQVFFEAVMARYMRFIALEEIDGGSVVRAAEIGVIPGGFDEWRRARALHSARPGDDPDSNGLPILVEYASAIDSDHADAEVPIYIGMGPDGAPRVLVRRREELPDVAAVLQHSSDLAQWSAVPPVDLLASHSNGDGSIRDEYEAGGQLGAALNIYRVRYELQ